MSPKLIANPSMSSRDLAVALTSYIAADEISDILSVIHRKHGQWSVKKPWSGAIDAMTMVKCCKLVSVVLKVAPNTKVNSLKLNDALEIMMLSFLF